MQINLESMAIEMPRVAGHPNRLPFRGVLTLVDVASDKPPAGARGHRVMLTRAAAEKALPSLLGMALDFTPNLDGHDARRKVGVITSAEIVPAGAPSKPSFGLGGNGPTQAKTWLGWGTLEIHRDAWQLEIEGYIFARDFPDVVEMMRGRQVAEPTQRQNRAQGGAPDGPHAGAPNALGMSYEIANARVADVNAAVWILTEATFTGAAMLLRSKAAYPNTWIELDTPSERHDFSRAERGQKETRL
jgi:hypothetical protein